MFDFTSMVPLAPPLPPSLSAWKKDFISPPVCRVVGALALLSAPLGSTQFLSVPPELGKLNGPHKVYAAISSLIVLRGERVFTRPPLYWPLSSTLT